MAPKIMRAARLHKVGQPMVLEELPVPTPGPQDALIEVKACGVVPNLGNVLTHWETWFPELPLPKLPSVFGLDTVGVVAELGPKVQHFKVGDRVYCNPAVACNNCRACRNSDFMNCQNLAFQGYFGFGPEAQRQFDSYPHGGLCEYKTVPARNMVKLPDNVTFDQAARFGYLGTGYGALAKAGAGPHDTCIINGVSGTLGLGTCLIALARGVRRIFGTGRNKDLLARVKKIAPERIGVHSLDDGSIADWVRKETDGYGADIGVDCLGPGAPGETMMDAIYGLRRGGKYVNVGGTGKPIMLNVHWMMDAQIAFLGGNWFTPGQGQDMADMAERGLLDLSIFEHRKFKLADVNQLMASIPDRNGGFTNFVVNP